jgi:hypothetical protein
MAKATKSLSPKRIQERVQRHRSAVITLAMQRAKKAVKDQLRARGVKLIEVKAKDIRILADAYFDVHRAELITEAADTINTSPFFERWRLPTEVFAKVTEIEHSPNANGAITGQMVND